jgi:hypothetical protein
MVWKPGISGNANGRPSGFRNNRTTEIVQKLIGNGFKDPLIALSELVTNSQNEQTRITAASALAPYLHGKLVSRPSPIYLDHPVSLPHPNPTKLE